MIQQQEIREALQPFSSTLRSTLAGSPQHQKALEEVNVVVAHLFKRIGRVMNSGREVMGVAVLSGYNFELVYRG